MRTLAVFLSISGAVAGAVGLVSAAPPGAVPAPPAAPVSSGPLVTNGLVWDALAKEYTSKPSERFARFVFCFTNVSAGEVSIHSANSSCFCTVAKLPTQPWRIQPGSNGPIEVTMDLAGKMGRLQKGVFVDTTAGRYNLTVTTTITPPDPNGPAAAPTMNDADRLKNMQTALADRQAIFKRAECVSCHADPAKGRSDGALLYAGVCANCHDSPHRASTVPDLRALNHPTDFEHWKRWITYGRAGSMMPAFTQAEGGPLTEPQIAAIAQYLLQTVPSRPGAGSTPPGGTQTR